MLSSQDDLVNSWRSAADRPNVLVVNASAQQAGWTTMLTALRSGERPCEVVVADTAEIGLRLLRRAAINVLAVDGDCQQPGTVELVVEALGKDKPPRVLVFSSQASFRDAAVKRPVRRVRKDVEKDTLQRLVLQCVQEAAAGDTERTSASELLEAVSNLPDALWLRITNHSGEAGDLCIQGRSAVYAEASRLMGEAAGMRILSWRDCQFEPRELPECLRPNMSRPLAQIGRGLAQAPHASTTPSDVFLMPEIDPSADTGTPLEPAAMEQTAPEVAAIAAPVVGDDDLAMVDEPMEFPSLEGFSVEWAAEVDLPAEPEDLPVFAIDAAAASTEQEAELSAVEEPVDILMDLDFSTVTMETGTGEIRVTESLFAAVAVLGSSGSVESCQPVSDIGYFDPTWLRGHYVQAEQYALSRGLGIPVAVPILTELGGIVVAPLNGQRDRLLAVRLRSPNFGELELAELKRVHESLPASGEPAYRS